jgi:geranylgeranyl pyrophosphate synthase
MLIHLLSAAGGEDREFLVDFLRGDREDRSQDDVAAVRDMMTRHGSIEYGRQYARALAEQAESAFEAAFGSLPDTPDRRFLSGVVDFVISREL